MTYYDGYQLWDQCRRCGSIQAVRHFPHRRGYLVPLCADCAEEGAILLAHGRSVVKISGTRTHLDFHFLEEDYEIIE